ncbi:phage tail assembly protein [Aquamicrobium terrae]
MSGKITVTLSKPITVEGKEVTALSLREPTLGDLITAESVGKGNNLAKVAATLAAMADIPLPAFHSLSARDFAKINEEAAPLLGREE